MKSPAFQWYPKDCDTDENVRAMDDSEFGFYVRCLNHAWLNDGLPSDISEFARVMGKTNKQFLRLWARVSKCFFLENSSKRFKNSRQELQRSQQESFKKSRVEAAKSRWLNTAAMHVHNLADANNVQVQCSASASASASANTLFDVSAAAEPKPKKSKKHKNPESELKETSLPPDWEKYAMSKYGWSSHKCLDEFEKFSDHHAAKGSTMFDWLAAWRKWCRNSITFSGNQGGLISKPAFPNWPKLEVPKPPEGWDPNATF